MQHFFADPSCVDGEQIRLAGSDVNHMKNVLRMKPGEEVWISDGEGTDYFCKVEGYEEKEAVLRVVKKEVSQTELASRLILFQGLPKGEKMEWIVQKAVELGAYCIVPFAAKRSVVKLDQKKAGKKRERWQAIAKGAAEQSKRGIVPQVRNVMSFREAIGPEGGFDESEIDQAKETGAIPITLGKRILRTETAGLTTLSILMYHLECREQLEDKNIR